MPSSRAPSTGIAIDCTLLRVAGWPADLSNWPCLAFLAPLTELATAGRLPVCGDFGPYLLQTLLGNQKAVFRITSAVPVFQQVVEGDHATALASCVGCQVASLDEFVHGCSADPQQVGCLLDRHRL